MSESNWLEEFKRRFSSRFDIYEKGVDGLEVNGMWDFIEEFIGKVAGELFTIDLLSDMLNRTGLDKTAEAADERWRNTIRLVISELEGRRKLN